jgi:hypothetical protein
VPPSADLDLSHARQADAKKPADQAFSVARGIYDNQPIVYAPLLSSQEPYMRCLLTPFPPLAATSQKAVDSIYVIKYVTRPAPTPAADADPPSADPALSQQLSATVSGSKKMASDLAGDAGAKISALQNALLEELGNLKVGPVRVTSRRRVSY